MESLHTQPTGGHNKEGNIQWSPRTPSQQAGTVRTGHPMETSHTQPTGGYNNQIKNGTSTKSSPNTSSHKVDTIMNGISLLAPIPSHQTGPTKNGISLRNPCTYTQPPSGYNCNMCNKERTCTHVKNPSKPSQQAGKRNLLRHQCPTGIPLNATALRPASKCRRIGYMTRT